MPDTMDDRSFDAQFLHELNDDCILELFKHLDVQNLFKLSSFNDRLANLFDFHFGSDSKCINDLFLVHRKMIRDTFTIRKDMTKTMQFLEQDFKNIGHLLERVECATNVFHWKPIGEGRFETFPSVRFPHDYIQLVEKYCAGKKLKHLSLELMYISCEFVTNRVLFGGLTTLCVSSIRVQEFWLGEICALCTSLEKLEIKEMKITGAFLLRISSSVRQISICNTNQRNCIDADILMKFVNKNPQLTGIALNDSIVWQLLPGLLPIYQHLNTAEFDGIDCRPKCKLFNTELGNALALNTVKLRRLIVSRYEIDDFVMDSIGQMKSLAFLGLVYNTEVDIHDNDFQHIFTNLIHLETLFYLPYEFLSEQRFLAIIKNGVRLHELIVDVDTFSLELYMKVVHIVQQRDNKKPLTLILKTDELERTPEVKAVLLKYRHFVDLKCKYYFDISDYFKYANY